MRKESLVFSKPVIWQGNGTGKLVYVDKKRYLISCDRMCHVQTVIAGNLWQLTSRVILFIPCFLDL